MNNYLTCLIQFLVLIPAAVMCYLPMKKTLRHSPLRTAALLGAAFVIFFTTPTGILNYFRIGRKAGMFAVFFVWFFSERP